jgi:hypothetical protein
MRFTAMGDVRLKAIELLESGKFMYCCSFNPTANCSVKASHLIIDYSFLPAKDDFSFLFRSIFLSFWKQKLPRLLGHALFWGRNYHIYPIAETKKALPQTIWLQHHEPSNHDRLR